MTLQLAYTMGPKNEPRRNLGVAKSSQETKQWFEITAARRIAPCQSIRATTGATTGLRAFEPLTANSCDRGSES